MLLMPIGNIVLNLCIQYISLCFLNLVVVVGSPFMTWMIWHFIISDEWPLVLKCLSTGKTCDVVSVFFEPGAETSRCFTNVLFFTFCAGDGIDNVYACAVLRC